MVPNSDCRMLLEIAGQDVAQMNSAEGQGHSDAQHAANDLLRIAGLAIRIVDFLQDTFAACVIGAARIGQAELTGAPLHQSDSKVSFDRGDMLAGHGGRQTEAPRCSDQAALLGGCSEHRHAGEAIHNTSIR